MKSLISLDLHVSKFSSDGDVNDYYNRYDYDVKLVDEETDEEFLIGKGTSVLYLLEKSVDDSYDMMDAFDDNHHEGFYDLLFDERGCVKDEWEESMTINGNRHGNILVQDRLELLPDYQHKRYGEEVRHILRNLFYGCYGLEIIHSFPLQLELFDNSERRREQMHYDEMEHDSKIAFDSLSSYYRKSGYEQYNNSEYFFRFPSPDSLEDDME